MKEAAIVNNFEEKRIKALEAIEDIEITLKNIKKSIIERDEYIFDAIDDALYYELQLDKSFGILNHWL